MVVTSSDKVLASRKMSAIDAAGFQIRDFISKKCLELDKKNCDFDKGYVAVVESYFINLNKNYQLLL